MKIDARAAVALVVHSNRIAGELEVRRTPGWSLVELGDASFSERFLVASPEPDKVPAVLTDAVRHHLLRLDSHASSVVLRSGELDWVQVVQERGGGPKVLDLVKTGLEVARLLG
jgi:hypothetical protein